MKVSPVLLCLFFTVTACYGCYTANWWAVLDKGNVWATCDFNRREKYIRGFWRSSGAGSRDIVGRLEQARCCGPPASYQSLESECVKANWWKSLDTWVLVAWEPFVSLRCRRSRLFQANSFGISREPSDHPFTRPLPLWSLFPRPSPIPERILPETNGNACQVRQSQVFSLSVMNYRVGVVIDLRNCLLYNILLFDSFYCPI